MVTTGSGSPFIGRIEELETFERALQQLAVGGGSVIAVAGEAGMGKTRLMVEIADLAAARDTQVLWSQMVEDPGAPPYFCWMLALRACLQYEANSSLLSEMGAATIDLADILPELRDQLDLPAERRMPETAASYQLYDAVSQLIFRAAARRPLVLLLDNLHCADPSSLALLDYFCKQINGRRVLVVAAYRESELHRRKSLRSSLNNISRLSGFTRLVMTGLSRVEVAELLHRYLNFPLPSTLVDAVYQQSDGNPLFINEVGSMLANNSRHYRLPERGFRFAVPDSLRELITARLDDLPGETRHILGIAAVFGREFDLQCLAELNAFRLEPAAHALQPALSSGIIETLEPERFRFHHVLFREVLYAEHSTVSRILLHRKSGDYLQRRYGDDLQPYISQLAHHAFEAAQTGPDGRAVHYCRLAAEDAIARRAFSEASELYECALQAAELDPTSTTERRFELLLGLGRAQYLSGQLNDSTTNLMKAAIEAYRRQDWVRLAEALFQFQHVCQQSGLRHVSSAPLHLAVLEHLPTTASSLRARVLASLAKAYRTAGDPESAASAFHEGLAIARGQSDPDLLLSCLRKGNWVIGRNPQGVSEGLDIALEAYDLAHTRGQTEAILDSLTDVIFQLCDLGDIEELGRRLRTLKSLALAERQVHFLNNVLGFETATAILQGHWLRALRGARETLQQVPLQAVHGLQGRFAFQMFAIHRALGSLDEFAELVDRIVADDDSSRRWMPGQILLHCELGQLRRARAVLLQLGEMNGLPRDDLYPVALVYLAESCVRLRDIPRCTLLYKQLVPYRGLNVTLPGALMLGAASGYLALLASTMGQTREARVLFEEAIEMNARMRARPAGARAMVDYAQLLLDSGRQRDRAQAQSLLDQALHIAKQLALRPLQQNIEDLGSSVAIGTLSKREAEVLELVAAGYSNSNVAEALHISHATVATHLRSILRKTGSSNRTEAADYGRRIGVIGRV